MHVGQRQIKLYIVSLFLHRQFITSQLFLCVCVCLPPPRFSVADSSSSSAGLRGRGGGRPGREIDVQT